MKNKVDITLELLIKKGLDLETAYVLMELIQLHEYNNQYLDKKGLEKIIKEFKKDK